MKTQINEWPTNKYLPFWEAKRAGLMAEIGDIEAAGKILEQSLSNIRKQLNLSPVSDNYLLVSQEAYVMQLLQYVNSSIAFRNGCFDNQVHNKENFSERWNDLKNYKCDPWNEQKIFEIKLENPPVSYSNNVKKSGFDIGHVTISYSFGRTDNEALNAYSFLRYNEEIGLPFRIENCNHGEKAAEGAVKRISGYSPFWAFATLIRIGDKKVVDTVFNREFIYGMNISEIDTLIYDYLSAIENAIPEIIVVNSIHDDNFANKLVTVIPEILSRLCVRCSDNARLKLLDFLKELYLADYKHKFQGVNNLAKRLISSLSDEKQYELLPKFLQFPILSDLSEMDERQFPDPFDFISINDKLINSFETIKTDDKLIKHLIEHASATNRGRKRAISRLGKLYEFKLLSDKQIEEFSKVLWNQVDQHSGFPQNTNFYKFAFLTLPHPHTVEPSKLFKKFILNERIPIQSLKKDKGVTMTGGNLTICDEMINGTKNKLINDKGVEWSKQEATAILEHLIEWWDYDKIYLKQDDDPAHLARFQMNFILDLRI